MLFSSITFLYWFLPITLGVYFVARLLKAPLKVCNGLLLGASIIFYAWGEPKYVLLMLAQSLSGWVFGLLIERWRGTFKAKLALSAVTAIAVGGLLVFKYADFFVANINFLPGVDIPLLKLALPIGISFYTFQLLSYDIDLYLGKINVQRNYFTFATYVTLFPQMMAGPIVRYQTIEGALTQREHSVSRFALGIRRFVIGLGKKVLIANVLGELVHIYQAGGENSVLFAWLYIVAYALHIYFDFSGYSDMAIGLGHMFGFRFLENFNYPYIAKSITEFWRRWHISLSSWFRDYVYIPLGGNRRRQVVNILIVWFLTGFWHGAGWTFISWGVFFGLVLLLEKFILHRALAHAPGLLRHMYVLLIVLISWMFFDAPSIGLAVARIGYLFGIGVDSLTGMASLYYLRSYALPLLIGVVGATPWPKFCALKLADNSAARSILVIAEPLFLAAVLLLATAYLVDGSFNPFIYFRF